MKIWRSGPVKALQAAVTPPDAAYCGPTSVASVLTSRRPVTGVRGSPQGALSQATQTPSEAPQFSSPLNAQSLREPSRPVSHLRSSTMKRSSGSTPFGLTSVASHCRPPRKPAIRQATCSRGRAYH